MPGKTNAITKTNPAKASRDSTVAILRLQGKSYREMAKILGYSPTQLCNLVNNDSDIKALIEEGSRLQATMLPDAMLEHAKLIHDEESSIRLQAVRLTYQNTGITPTHTPPPALNLIMVQQQTLLDPALLAPIARYFAAPEDVQEAETLPNTTNEGDSDK